MSLRDMSLKDMYIGLFVVILFLITYVTLPRVDYVEPDVLFYLKQLTPLYYVSLIVFAFVAFLNGHRLIQVLCITFFSWLVMLTPFIMFVNPWLIDSYIFAAEPVYVARNGWIGDFHTLLESPALGLTFAPFFSLTGIDPLVFMKFYPALVVLILTLVIAMIGETVAGRKGFVIAPLFLISIMWPNTFHVNRQNFSLVFYLTSILLLMWIVLEKQKGKRIWVPFCMQLFLMVLAHPATPLFFIANVVSAALIGSIKHDFGRRELKLMMYAALFAFSTWFLWNSIQGKGNIFEIVKTITSNLFSSLLEGRYAPAGIERLFWGYTPMYSLIINTRLVLTLAVLIVGFLTPLIGYLHYKDGRIRRILVFLIGWNLSNMFSVVPLMYAGLPYFYRPALFAFISSAPIPALICEPWLDEPTIASARLRKRSIAVLVLIMISSFLMPIVKYAPLPYLYPPSLELSEVRFVDMHLSGRKIVSFEYTPPYGYSYLYGVRGATFVVTDVSRITNNQNLTRPNYVFLTYRIVARDAFYIHNPILSQTVAELSENLTLNTHNKVYDAGYPNWILAPRP